MEFEISNLKCKRKNINCVICKMPISSKKDKRIKSCSDECEKINTQNLIKLNGKVNQLAIKELKKRYGLEFKDIRNEIREKLKEI